MLACPRCDKLLDAEGTKPSAEKVLFCPACKVEFPYLEDVPFLWAEPDAARQDWRNRWNFALAELDAELAGTRQQGKRDQHPQSTLARLDDLAAGLERYQTELTSLLAPLGIGTGYAAPNARETHLALRSRLPRHHHVLSYMANVHRDWGWGENENQLTLDTVLNSLVATSTAPPATILVLGAGAGRLAYDLHQHFRPSATYAVDSNPLLSLVGSYVSQGRTVSLTEFPIAPLSSHDAAVVRELSAPGPAHGLTFVCADALRLPFAAQSVDLVVTPWLIDVIDAPLEDLAAEISRVLHQDGHWLNHGSMAFEGASASRLTLLEVHEVAQRAGFEIRDARDANLPYLQSPASRHHRQEITHTFTAELTKVPSKKDRSRFKHLPDWIVVGKAPIPLTPSFQSQIATTRIHAFIMSLIDGNRSLEDMAQVLEEQKLMSKPDATSAIRNFLTTMYEEAARSK